MTVAARSSTLDLVRQRASGRRALPKSGLNFHVALRVEEVVEAWQLVYQAYLRAGLILPNRHEIHLVPWAIHPGTVVAVGDLPGMVCATISGYMDRAGGLPLDSVYREEMKALRDAGRVLMEVGLLADRREDLVRSLDATLELMKYAFFHGIYMGATDLVIGVHPHHARFYERIFAFDTFGAESTCPTVNDAPVVGLRLNLAAELARDPLPKGLRFFVDSALEPAAFEGRLELSSKLFAKTPVAPFLTDSYGLV